MEYCKNCEHNEVCRYRETVEKYIQNNNIFVGCNVDISTIDAPIVCTCKYRKPKQNSQDEYTKSNTDACLEFLRKNSYSNKHNCDTETDFSKLVNRVIK